MSSDCAASPFVAAWQAVEVAQRLEVLAALALDQHARLGDARPSREHELHEELVAQARARRGLGDPLVERRLALGRQAVDALVGRAVLRHASPSTSPSRSRRARDV